MSTVEIPEHTTHSLTVFSPILSYKHLISVCVRMEKQVHWVCVHVCGETGGYLEQRQRLGVRSDPGRTLQLCVCVCLYQRVKVWPVSNSSRWMLINYTI